MPYIEFDLRLITEHHPRYFTGSHRRPIWQADAIRITGFYQVDDVLTHVINDRNAYKKISCLKIQFREHVVTQQSLFYSINVTGVILNKKMIPVSF